MFLYAFFLFRHHMLMVLPLAAATVFIGFYAGGHIERLIAKREQANLPRWKQGGLRR
ncbi:MAG TPA: hypothetical protein VMS78_15365 [Rhizomicrobium sp.]|nr:hypothetical protein [Rhizomicrobium sp.]